MRVNKHDFFLGKEEVPSSNLGIGSSNYFNVY